MSINIHGKEYVTVAERLTEAHEDIQSIETQVLTEIANAVVIKATVLLKDGRIFTGISGANQNKAIEKMSPYEVAETSAVGRALGFAGYGAVESIASADEMVKSEIHLTEEKTLGQQASEAECPIHHKPYTKGQYGWYCKTKMPNDKWCAQKPYSQIADKPKAEEEPPIDAYLD